MQSPLRVAERVRQPLPGRCWRGVGAFACAFATCLIPCLAAAQVPREEIRVTVPMKVLKYAEHVLRKHDVNGDGRLAGDEIRGMQGDPLRADEDGDNQIAADELARHVARYGYGRSIRLMPPSAEYLIRFSSAEGSGVLEAAGGTGSAVELLGAIGGGRREDADQVGDDRPKPAFKRFAVPASRVPPGLPAWFQERDGDGDLQLTRNEFAPRPTPDELREFTEYDANRDGLVTAWELLGLPAAPQRAAER